MVPHSAWRVSGRFAVAQKRPSRRRRGRSRRLVRHQSKIGRDTDPRRGKVAEQSIEHLLAFVRMLQNTGALPMPRALSAAAKRRGRCVRYSRQVQMLSPPDNLCVPPCRRAFCVREAEITSAARIRAISRARRAAIDWWYPPRAHLLRAQTAAASTRFRPTLPHRVLQCTRVTPSSCPGKTPATVRGKNQGIPGVMTGRNDAEARSARVRDLPHRDPRT